MRFPRRALLSFCFVAACGGKVSVDDQGSGRNGASGPGSGSGSTGAGNTEDLCDRYCELYTRSGCLDRRSCMPLCIEYGEILGKCKPLYLARLACLIANPVECNEPFPPQCDDEADAMDECTVECSSTTCSGPDANGCTCETSCSQEATCEWDPNGGATCQCRVTGALVGECHEPDVGLACDPVAGCCTFFF